MRYKTSIKSSSYLDIFNSDVFYVLITNYRFETRNPTGENTFKKLTYIKFNWIFWRFELLIRKA